VSVRLLPGQRSKINGQSFQLAIYSLGIHHIRVFLAGFRPIRFFQTRISTNQIFLSCDFSQSGSFELRFPPIRSFRIGNSANQVTLHWEFCQSYFLTQRIKSIGFFMEIQLITFFQVRNAACQIFHTDIQPVRF
jgi:hypothetical protein